LAENVLISAIIPTYNRADVVCAAVDSVLAQTYRNIEIIVVDDGSTDDTRARLRRYGDSVRVIWQQNAGAAAARNAGVRVASGEIVTFLDSDDLWLPRKIEKQVALLFAAGASVSCCVTNMKLYFRNGRVGTSFESAAINPVYPEGIWVNPAEVLTTRFLMFNQCVAMRRKAFDQAGGFDERLRVLEDHDLALRLSLCGPWAFMREPLVEWKQSEDSLSHLLKDSPAFKSTWMALIEDFTLRIPPSPGFVKVRGLALRASRGLRRELKLRAMSQSTRKMVSIVGRVQRKVQQLWWTAYQHSAWYPRMKTITLNEYQSANRQVCGECGPELASSVGGAACGHSRDNKPRKAALTLPPPDAHDSE
jgi:glycosyltransferase involved in cell wall biosynthesis